MEAEPENAFEDRLVIKFALSKSWFMGNLLYMMRAKLDLSPAEAAVMFVGAGSTIPSLTESVGKTYEVSVTTSKKLHGKRVHI